VIEFFDTSALAKRYLPEPGSPRVRALLARGDVVVSVVAYAEVLAALARAWREGILDDDGYAKLTDRVEADFRALDVVLLRPSVLRHVRSLVTRHPLRGYDAIQLASALETRLRGSPVRFWCADAALTAAAAAEGLAVGPLR